MIVLIIPIEPVNKRLTIITNFPRREKSEKQTCERKLVKSFCLKSQQFSLLDQIILFSCRVHKLMIHSMGGYIPAPDSIHLRFRHWINNFLLRLVCCVACVCLVPWTDFMAVLSELRHQIRTLHLTRHLYLCVGRSS